MMLHPECVEKAVKVALGAWLARSGTHDFSVLRGEHRDPLVADIMRFAAQFSAEYEHEAVSA